MGTPAEFLGIEAIEDDPSVLPPPPDAGPAPHRAGWLLGGVAAILALVLIFVEGLVYENAVDAQILRRSGDGSESAESLVGLYDSFWLLPVLRVLAIAAVAGAYLSVRRRCGLGRRQDVVVLTVAAAIALGILYGGLRIAGAASATSDPGEALEGLAVGLKVRCGTSAVVAVAGAVLLLLSRAPGAFRSGARRVGRELDRG